MCITKLMYRIVRFGTTTVEYRGHRFKAHVADTPPKRMLGLMHRDMLGSGECMLFVFGREARYGVWMLNMHFAIDIVWLSREGKVVHIVKNARPCGNILNCRTYAPKISAKYIVEMNSGMVEKYSIERWGIFSIGN